ncbi:hypothetical protein Bca52824_071557 [Brassica carinata]|uniref:Uncharacterized protein n=1 Tax=Brassica carinata TaxID=52824 RepID=A0A8X7Q7M0_BRACI|nr:hypothetical protein Bca52824_071557 [Brassica carinata]
MCQLPPMAINQLHFSNLKAGRCKEIVVTCLLRFWETSNVKKACERLDVDLVLWTRSLLIHVLAHIAFEACRIQNLPKLVEDIFQTSINTDPGGALRLVQRRSGLCWVRGEWLNDILRPSTLPVSSNFSSCDSLQCTRVSGGLPTVILLLHQLFSHQNMSKSFSKAPPVPFEEVHKILQEELGRSIDNVLKPGTEDFLVAGLNFTYDVSRIFEFLSLEFGRTSLELFLTKWIGVQLLLGTILGFLIKLLTCLIDSSVSTPRPKIRDIMVLYAMTQTKTVDEKGVNAPPLD